MKEWNEVSKHNTACFGIAAHSGGILRRHSVRFCQHIAVGCSECYFRRRRRCAANRIILRFRIPKAVTALLAGAALGASGLQMQTLFRNPLAGPYVLGISSGATLGVAVFLLGAPMLGECSLWLRDIGMAGAGMGGSGMRIFNDNRREPPHKRHNGHTHSRYDVRQRGRCPLWKSCNISARSLPSSRLSYGQWVRWAESRRHKSR